jgi:hypothetical protein
MASPETILGDPLSEVSRKERRALLGVSATGLVVAYTGLVPSEIANLGIRFSPTDRSWLLKLLALIVLYFVVAFVAYASSDIVKWRLA